MEPHSHTDVKLENVSTVSAVATYSAAKSSHPPKATKSDL